MARPSSRADDIHRLATELAAMADELHVEVDHEDWRTVPEHAAEVIAIARAIREVAEGESA